MKLSEMRGIGLAELKRQLDEAHRELFNLRFRATTRQLVNHREIPRVKKEIARLNTLIREKELGTTSESQ